MSENHIFVFLLVRKNCWPFIWCFVLREEGCYQRYDESLLQIVLMAILAFSSCVNKKGLLNLEKFGSTYLWFFSQYKVFVLSQRNCWPKWGNIIKPFYVKFKDDWTILFSIWDGNMLIRKISKKLFSISKVLTLPNSSVPTSNITNPFSFFLNILQDFNNVWRSLGDAWRPSNISLFKVNNRNTRKSCEIHSKLTIKTLERHQWPRFSVLIVNFENISHLFYWFYCWL